MPQFLPISANETISEEVSDYCPVFSIPSSAQSAGLLLNAIWHTDQKRHVIVLKYD